MRTDVTLRRLDEDVLADLLAAAVAGADPLEVMPPVAGPPGWTPERREAFLDFHRARSLSATPVETTYAIVAGGTVAGAARLRPVDGVPGAVETGVWIDRPRRGTGVGRAVLGLLVAEARAAGATRLHADTTAGNQAARSLLARLGATMEVHGDEVTAWADLTTAGPR
ncbi:hypothetical protein Sru01_56130 [Sphaerisporangium rufum]|uniref:N-acetyltransferase domain-containing protein n=1 Tax=Sphaerisporangium rufum TaxID=1381558 RepID=A0A919R6K4_9ACTN|nr:GNAT family N-acetyltransferase [Sphaerisporangium rufum]GII80631.1 hypothetical protein Sru01_56130 [Sphaerisporangium rufum]